MNEIPRLEKKRIREMLNLGIKFKELEKVKQVYSSSLTPKSRQALIQAPNNCHV